MSRCALVLVVLAISRTKSQDFVPDNFEVVTQEGGKDFGAIEKCGEGSQEGKYICVNYDKCDGITHTIIQDGRTDGFGLIDIRFGGENAACPHYLEVCCQLPNNTDPTSTSQTPPVITPSESTPVVTIPTQKPPVIGNFCGKRNPNGIDFKITGNTHNEAEYGEFPWMVAILKKNYDPAVDETLAICGGSLITPRVVLTGAHCVYKYKTNEIKVRAGEWDTQTTRERLPYQEVDIAQMVVHKDFKAEVLYNDVALLIMEQNFQRAEHIGTICLPNQGQLVDSKNCLVTGWGKTSFGREGPYQVILKKIELPMVLHDSCQEKLRKTRLGPRFVLDKSFTCAGGDQGKDACTGDGGSPLMCPDPNDPSRYLQAGIVAWGIGCGEADIPGVYVDVSRFRNWVDESLKRLNIQTEPFYTV